MKPLILISMLAAPIPSAIAWLAGFNFDERGFPAVVIGVATLFCIVFPLTYPKS